ncbi:hypothetical protein M0805_004288 [Coniferiporia weirii]|nr:hypothetical protein M0805_004288 [Coniferiporia weirii]
MPSLLRTLMLVLPAVLAATFITAPLLPVLAIASPAPLPMPLLAVDYGGHVAPIPYATRHNMVKRAYPRPIAVGHAVPVAYLSTTQKAPLKSVNATSDRHAVPVASSTSHASRRDGADVNTKIAALSNSRDIIVQNSKNLQDLAAQSASGSVSGQFQQDAASKLTDFQTSMQDFSGLFGQLSADDGLANYDNTDQVETLLKDVINAHKAVLESVYQLVQNIPVLGPILGPIVYELKCIIDGVLDVVQNLTDGLLNTLAPLLLGLLGQTTTLICSPGFKVLGICL